MILEIHFWIDIIRHEVIDIQSTWYFSGITGPPKQVKDYGNIIFLFCGEGRHKYDQEMVTVSQAIHIYLP